MKQVCHTAMRWHYKHVGSPYNYFKDGMHAY